MDKLDRLAAGAIIALLCWALVVILTNEAPESASQNSRRKQLTATVRLDMEMEKRVVLVKKMFSGGNLDQAEALTGELVAAYPYSGTPYMLMGDIYLRRQQAISAMRQYRKAIDLNPDFLDKKTKVFQGKKIKKTVDEALAEINEGLADKPNSEELLDDKKVVYYMLRKLAGSCS